MTLVRAVIRRNRPTAATNFVSAFCPCLAASARPRDRRATDGIEANNSMLSRFFSADKSASKEFQVRQRIGLPPKLLSALGIVFRPPKRLGRALISSTHLADDGNELPVGPEPRAHAFVPRAIRLGKPRRFLRALTREGSKRFARDGLMPSISLPMSSTFLFPCCAMVILDNGRNIGTKRRRASSPPTRASCCCRYRPISIDQNGLREPQRILRHAPARRRRPLGSQRPRLF
ncbi:hypothetical protein ABIB90_007634 [Bradyrhizobium sp. JR4.1]